MRLVSATVLPVPMQSNTSCAGASSLLEVVRVVGRDERHVELARDFDQARR